MEELKVVFKSAFALLGIMVVVITVADRYLENPAQVSMRDHQT